MFLDERRLSVEDLPIQKAAATKSPVSVEGLEIRFVGGGCCIANCNALPLFDAEGQVRGAVGVLTDITAFRRTEAAFRGAEERERRKREELEAILAAIPAPVLIATDASCETMIGNPAAYELYRVPPGDNIAKSAPNGKAPANFEIFQNGRRLTGEELPIRKAAAKRAFSMEEIELRFVEGESKYLLGNALPLLDDAGEVRGAVAAFADVTEIKRKELALRETEALLRAVVDNAPVPIALLREDGKHLLINPAVTELTGYTASDIPTLDAWLRLSHPHWAPGVAETILANFGTEGVVFETVEVTTKSGEKRFWLQKTAPAGRDASGLRLRVGAALDITELKRKEDALLASGTELEAALASMSDAVIITDDKGNYIHFNEAYAAFCKFKSKEDCTKSAAECASLFDVFLPNGDPAPLDEWAVPRALRGETAIGAEYGLRCKDTGESLIGSYNFSPIRDASGKIVGSVVTSRDITSKAPRGGARQCAPPRGSQPAGRRRGPRLQQSPARHRRKSVNSLKSSSAMTMREISLGAPKAPRNAEAL